MKRPSLARGCLVLFALSLFTFACLNLTALYEGARFFVWPALTDSTQRLAAVSPNGRYAALYDLIHVTNIVRFGYLVKQLDLPDVSIQIIPIPASPQSDIFVQFHRAENQPLTVYAAHYDKIYDDSIYQAAFDNSSSVSVLLASIRALAQANQPGARAFLFTGEEERGLHGAEAFVTYARANNLRLREIINFDNLGRGALAISPPSNNPGYVFLIPLYGEMVFDGRGLTRMPPYSEVNSRLAKKIRCLDSQITAFRHFTTRGDVNIFEENGIDSVAIGGDDAAFADEVWHTYQDTADKIDEHNLDLAYDLIKSDRLCEPEE